MAAPILSFSFQMSMAMELAERHQQIVYTGVRLVHCRGLVLGMIGGTEWLCLVCVSSHRHMEVGQV